MYLLSYKDLTNTEYGFTDNTSRQKQVTDYAKALGCYMNTSDNYYNTGYYWLRSPYPYDSDTYDYFYSRYVYYDGIVHDGDIFGGRWVFYPGVGVSATITITL